MTSCSARLWSLWDMLNLNARYFLGVVTELRAIQMIIAGIEDRTVAVAEPDQQVILTHLGQLIDFIQAIGARSTYRSAERLQASLMPAPPR